MGCACGRNVGQVVHGRRASSIFDWWECGVAQTSPTHLTGTEPMSLMIILLATLIAGIGSVWVAYSLVSRADAINAQHGYIQQGMLGLAAGALLSTSFTHLLPEALESGVDKHSLFLVLLIGLVFFFLLSKAELWHHGHEHSDAHGEHKGAGWSLLVGDGLHCFGDGVLIASIFMTDPRLGVIAAASVLVHEVPHHMGDLVALRVGEHHAAALHKLSLAGAVTALGGGVGYLLLDRLQQLQPFLMAVAGSSFIYVALSDLVPQLQQRRSRRDTAIQAMWLVMGIVLVVALNELPHGDLVH